MIEAGRKTRDANDPTTSQATEDTVSRPIIGVMSMLKRILRKLLDDDQIEELISVREVVRASRQAVVHACSSRWLPEKPSVVNLLVNDVCNSRCVMCNIWRQEPAPHFSTDELESILQDPLFKEVKYVGVSGGEPTLRADLPELFSSILKSLPGLEGTGLITNAFSKSAIKSRLVDCAAVCEEAGVPFNVMVSLDGIGSTHDLIRGKTGAYDRAVSLVRFLRDETAIPVFIGCTISKKNVWETDSVLEFCESEQVVGRFRVAEFIDRLYNRELKDDIRSFSPEERYHLALFFFRLEVFYEESEIVQWTYRNIRQMLWEEKPRAVMCPAQTSAVTLNSRGQLLYCAPKSPLLGSAHEESALAVYRRNLKTRRRIIKENCDGCIHDYHSNPKLSERIRLERRLHWRRKLSFESVLRRKECGPRRLRVSHGNGDTRVLITGWYGTETAGDKAILGQIVHEVSENRPGAEIWVSSFNPFLTKQTLIELGIENVKIVPTYDRGFFDCVDRSEEIIMGGGPLMHIDDLGIVLAAFSRAKRNGSTTIVWGCGIGPLHRGPNYREAVRQILCLSDSIWVRDSESAIMAREMTGRTDVRVIGDPAEKYIRRWRKAASRVNKKTPYLGLYLREWPFDYAETLDSGEYLDKRNAFEDELGRWINFICGKLGLSPRLIPMHHFCIGGDDRVFNRRFARMHLVGTGCEVEHRPVSLGSILHSMISAELVVCMRFHSVVFAKTLGVPFVAIDYTNGGKISGFLADHGMLDRCVSLEDIAHGRWANFDMDQVILSPVDG